MPSSDDEQIDRVIRLAEVGAPPSQPYGYGGIRNAKWIAAAYRRLRIETVTRRPPRWSRMSMRLAQPARAASVPN